MRKKHDAILIATGVYKAREVDLPGKDLANIFPAMEFLTASNKKGLGDKVELFDNGTLNAEGKDIVVIGGGDTAMDCVRTSVRQNAKSVKCLYRRDKRKYARISPRSKQMLRKKVLNLFGCQVPKNLLEKIKLKV